jgi:hypothetical protein
MHHALGRIIALARPHLEAMVPRLDEIADQPFSLAETPVAEKHLYVDGSGIPYGGRNDRITELFVDRFFSQQKCPVGMAQMDGRKELPFPGIQARLVFPLQLRFHSTKDNHTRTGGKDGSSAPPPAHSFRSFSMYD